MFLSRGVGGDETRMLTKFFSILFTQRKVFHYRGAADRGWAKHFNGGERGETRKIEEILPGKGGGSIRKRNGTQGGGVQTRGRPKKQLVALEKPASGPHKHLEEAVRENSRERGGRDQLCLSI